MSTRTAPSLARSRRRQAADVDDDPTLDPGVANELNALSKERRYRNSQDPSHANFSNVRGGSSSSAPTRKDYLSRMKSAVGDLAHGYWPGQRKRKP